MDIFLHVFHVFLIFNFWNFDIGMFELIPSISDGGRKVFPEKENFCITESLPVLQIFVWFSQREEGRGSDFWFLGLQRNHPYEGVAGFTCN